MQIQVVAVCHNCAGEPDVVGTKVTVTENEFAHGEHYDKAKVRLTEKGYEEPMVMFDPLEVKRLFHTVETFDEPSIKILEWCSAAQRGQEVIFEETQDA